MYRTEQSAVPAKKIYQNWFRAPHVARHARAGQFALLRVNESEECIPLTISTVRGDLARFIFMAIGKTIEQLATYKRGDSIRNVQRPLVRSSGIAKYGTCAGVGGEVGIANTPLIEWEVRG